MDGIPEPIARVAALMSSFEGNWSLCGGWAVDAWIGRQTREHGDQDIAVFQDDQRALFEHLRGWQLVAHDPDVDDDTSEVWDGVRRLGLPAHIHARSPDATGDLPERLDAAANQGFGLDQAAGYRIAPDTGTRVTVVSFMRLLPMEGFLMDPNPYDVLGIPVNASQWQIREAFKLMMRGVRKRMVSDPQAYETYQDIKCAYELLSDYGARCRYNTEHGLSEPPPPRTGPTRAGTWSWGDVVDAIHLFLVLLVSIAIFAFGVYAKLYFLDWLR